MTTPLAIETRRLKIRWLEVGDAPFIYTLVNDPTWIRYIGDKNVSNLEDAKAYIETGPLEMYRNLGFGLNHVSLKEDGTPIGICGLLKRETLTDVEIGFASFCLNSEDRAMHLKQPPRSLITAASSWKYRA